MAKTTPPTALQSTFALFNLCNTAIADIHNYRRRPSTSQPAAVRAQTAHRLTHLPRRLESALKRRPNTPPELYALIDRAIQYCRVYGSSPATQDRLQAAADWAKGYLQENTTPRQSATTLPPPPPSLR